MVIYMYMHVLVKFDKINNSGAYELNQNRESTKGYSR